MARQNFDNPQASLNHTATQAHHSPDPTPSAATLPEPRSCVRSKKRTASSAAAGRADDAAGVFGRRKSWVDHMADDDLLRQPSISPAVLRPTTASLRALASTTAAEGALLPQVKFVNATVEILQSQMKKEEAPKKKRTRTTPEQLRILQKAFAVDPMPNSNARLTLAKKLGMNARAVQVWFQNRRAKGKLEAKRAETTGTHDAHEMVLQGYVPGDEPTLYDPELEHGGVPASSLDYASAQNYYSQLFGVPATMYGLEAQHLRAGSVGSLPLFASAVYQLGVDDYETYSIQYGARKSGEEDGVDPLLDGAYNSEDMCASALGISMYHHHHHGTAGEQMALRRSYSLPDVHAQLSAQQLQALEQIGLPSMRNHLAPIVEEQELRASPLRASSPTAGHGASSGMRMLLEGGLLDFDELNSYLSSGPKEHVSSG